MSRSVAEMALQKAGAESMFLIWEGIWFQIFGSQTQKMHLLPKLGPCPESSWQQLRCL